MSIQTIANSHKNYPALLRQLNKPPQVLYYKGSLGIFFRPCLAVVGTRLPSAYGKRATAEIVGQLAAAGIGIISGLAYGIDAIAHEAALQAGGHTAAVLAGGLDRIYPSAHSGLATSLIKNGGCLISEFPPGMPPHKTNFPRRNRLIAGLSLGTLVIEAREKSGSLITARHALNDNRDVMAVPGSIYSPESKGTNQLIYEGAHPISCLSDVLAVLRLDRLPLIESQKTLVSLSEEEKKILRCLGAEPRHINDITQATALDMQTINSRLTIMDLKGVVKNTGNLHYIKTI